MNAYDGGVDVEARHLAAVGLMAHRVASQKHGRKTYFNINQHVNYTNIARTG